jgi:uncharacterized membrane protein
MEALQFDEKGCVILPQPDDIPEKDRDHAAGAYIMMFASQYFPLPLANLVASIIYHAVSRRRSRFVAFHTWQSLISQIPTTLITWAFVAAVIWLAISNRPEEWGGVFLGVAFVTAFVVVSVWNIVYIVLSIIAFRRAGRGRLYYLPVFGKMTYDKYFGSDAIPAGDAAPVKPINLPPGGQQSQG